MNPAEQPSFSRFRVLFSTRVLAWICAAVLVCGSLPLYIISFYNHPYYDDYGFSTPIRAAIVKSGDFSAVWAAAIKNSRFIRDTWQGTYTGTFLSNLQPGVFSESLYFFSTFLLLTAFLLAFGFFFHQVFRRLLNLSSHETVILISLVLTLMVQFMPDPGEAFFWFNGGIGNTFIYSLLALSFGLCISLEKSRSPLSSGLLVLALSLLMVMLGGGSYGGGIFGLLLFAGLTLWAFSKKNRWKWAYLWLSALFFACFLYSVTAPGNNVRSIYIPFQSSAPKAILQSLYHGVALIGSYIRLPLIGVTALLVPFFAVAAPKTNFSFRHPWLVLLVGGCLFCTQLAPPLYGVFSIGGGRIVNTYYQSFVVLWFLYAFYLTGFFLRKREREFLPLSPPNQQRLVFFCICLIFVGCMGYKQPGQVLSGPQNMAGCSAALSLINGEASAYHREMLARETLLKDESITHVVLHPLSTVPSVFMKDLLAEDAPYDVTSPLRLYYRKESVVVEGER